MEEDKKNIEEIINLSKEEIENNDENITAILDLEDLKSLQNLLTRYKQLEENKKIIQEKFREIADKNSYIKDMYIPKSKIQEKIEELKKKIDIAQGEELLIFDSKIDVLQELLLEEE